MILIANWEGTDSQIISVLHSVEITTQIMLRSFRGVQFTTLPSRSKLKLTCFCFLFFKDKSWLHSIPAKDIFVLAQRQKHTTLTVFFFLDRCTVNTMTRKITCSTIVSRGTLLTMVPPQRRSKRVRMFVSLKETQCFFDHDKVSPWCWTKKEQRTWIKQTNLHKTDLLPTGRPLRRATLRMRFRFYSFAPIFQCRQKQKRLILLLFQTTNFSGLYELQLPFHSPIADRVWKDVIRLLTLQGYNDDTIFKTCQALTIRPADWLNDEMSNRVQVWRYSLLYHLLFQTTLRQVLNWQRLYIEKSLHLSFTWHQRWKIFQVLWVQRSEKAFRQEDAACAEKISRAPMTTFLPPD